MITRLRFGLALFAFLCTIPFNGAVFRYWHPFRVAQYALGLGEPLVPHARGALITPAWVEATIACAAVLLPWLGAVLTLLPLLVTLRRGRRPGVAPALSFVAAATAAVGVAALVVMLTPRDWLDPSTWFHDAYGVELTPLQPPWVAMFFVPAVCLRLRGFRLLLPAAAVLAAWLAFFAAARMSQYQQLPPPCTARCCFPYSSTVY